VIHHPTHHDGACRLVNDDGDACPGPLYLMQYDGDGEIQNVPSEDKWQQKEI
jgi:hypothetical protein